MHLNTRTAARRGAPMLAIHAAGVLLLTPVIVVAGLLALVAMPCLMLGWSIRTSLLTRRAKVEVPVSHRAAPGTEASVGVVSRSAA